MADAAMRRLWNKSHSKSTFAGKKECADIYRQARPLADCKSDRSKNPGLAVMPVVEYWAKVGDFFFLAFTFHLQPTPRAP